MTDSMESADSKLNRREFLQKALQWRRDAPSFTRIMGKKATVINSGGEGSPR